MLNPKRLICTYDQGLAKPLPTTSYALVSRDILCYCHLQIGLTYILKSIASCDRNKAPTLEYTVNLAFMDYFHSFWNNGTLSHIPLTPTFNETVLPIAMEDYKEDPQFLFYGQNVKRNPQTLKELSQIVYQKQVFLNTRKELFSRPKAEIGPITTRDPLIQEIKKFFPVLSNIPHIHICRQFSRHYVANPMHFLCNQAKENENIGLCNGIAPDQAHRSSCSFNLYASRADRGPDNNKCPIPVRKTYRDGHSHKPHDKTGMP